MHNAMQCPSHSHRSAQWPQSRRLRLCQWRSDMQPEQHLEPNIPLTSVSFKQFAVACKLSVNCSSGYVRQNSAGKFDKSCFSTAKAFNNSDYLRVLTNLEAGYQFLHRASRSLSLKFGFRFYSTPTLPVTALCFHPLQPPARWSDPYRIWI